MPPTRQPDADPRPTGRPELPPGDRSSLEDLEKLDRHALLKRAEQLGPVFTGTSLGELCVCVVGLQLSRRLLLEHADSLRPLTLELEPLIPKGFLRQMCGEDHLVYRRALVRASRSLDTMVDQTTLDSIFASGLQDLSERSGRDGTAVAADGARRSPVLDVALDLATATLVSLFFGATPGTVRYDRLVARFQDLGPFGLVWNLKEPQHRAFHALRDELRSDLCTYEVRKDDTADMADASVLAQLAQLGNVDDTMLGNLIYMVEMGRHDIQTFFRWLLRYGSANPDVMAMIATDAAPPGPTSVAEAMVLEVLRSHQSERLVRRVTREIIFDNHLIPEGSYVRVCAWEAHHNPTTFPDPDRFDPDRFRHISPTNDQFSPFGIDNHQCPFGGLSIRLGVTLLRSLARYSASVRDDGQPVRGAYHWEPSRKLRLNMEPR